MLQRSDGIDNTFAPGTWNRERNSDYDGDTFAGGIPDTFDVELDEFIAKHPEWFAWSEFEQKRVSYGHYCITNEEYIEAITEKLLGFIKEDQETAKEKGIEPPVFYSVSFPDSESGFCQCEKCKGKAIGWCEGMRNIKGYTQSEEHLSTSTS